MCAAVRTVNSLKYFYKSEHQWKCWNFNLKIILHGKTFF